MKNNSNSINLIILSFLMVAGCTIEVGQDQPCDTTSQCIPQTCSMLSAMRGQEVCGKQDNGCGQVMVCGCQDGDQCRNDVCFSEPNDPQPNCTPKTCSQLRNDAGKDVCGMLDNGCGHTLDCGCGSQVCTDGVCQNPPPDNCKADPDPDAYCDPGLSPFICSSAPSDPVCQDVMTNDAHFYCCPPVDPQCTPFPETPNACAPDAIALECKTPPPGCSSFGSKDAFYYCCPER